MQTEKLETGAALRFANVSPTNWTNLLQRRLYPVAPAAKSGRPRLFNADDLTAAYVLGELFERRVAPSFAGQIACGVLRAIRKPPAVQSLSAWKCLKRNGTPSVVVSAKPPQPDSIELFRFAVGEIRDRAMASIRQQFGGDA